MARLKMPAAPCSLAHRSSATAWSIERSGGIATQRSRPFVSAVRSAPFIELLSFRALCISDLLTPWLRDRADGVIGLLNVPGVNVPGVQDCAVGRHPGVWRGPADSSGQRQLVERIEERQQGKFA